MPLFDRNYIRPDPQAVAVRAYLDGYDGIENSWVQTRGEYLAIPLIAEWHADGENGFIVYMKSLDGRQQINLAFFTDRKSGSIRIDNWWQKSWFPLTPETRQSTDIGVRYISGGRPLDAADHIMTKLEEFWEMTRD